MPPNSTPDLAELDRLHAAANLDRLSSYHITSPGYESMANLCEKEGSGHAVAMMRKEWADYFAAISNAYPALAARIRELESGEFVRTVMEMAKDIAARDARMKREGAAEWLENKAVEVNYLTSNDMKIEAARLREEK